MKIHTIVDMRILTGFLQAVLLVACTVFSSVYATDLGQLGKSYLIAEPNLIDTIKAMLEEKQKNGELERMHNEWADNAKDYVRRPPSKALPKAQIYRAFGVDPTYTLPDDIKDAEGNVLYKAGFTFNPLKIKPLTKTLCFIDGDDQEQINWLEEFCGNAISFKRILVNGDYNDVTNNTKAKIYYDQNGFLVSHFRIEAVPAVVRQSGDLLYVEEFKL